MVDLRTGPFTLEEIHRLKALTPRTQALRDRCLYAPIMMDASPARLLTESWKETEGQPQAVRRARALARDCIKKGKDWVSGGFRYMSISNKIIPVGHVNTADSLTAIKKLVYEEKSVTWDELLDAKRHPEQYRDLVVRVGGYSAFFVELAPEVQDEIIARTTQEV